MPLAKDQAFPKDILQPFKFDYMFCKQNEDGTVDLMGQKGNYQLTIAKNCDINKKAPGK